MRKRGRLLPGDATSIARITPALISVITRAALMPYLLPTLGGVSHSRCGWLLVGVVDLPGFGDLLRGMILPRLLDVGR